MIHRLLHLFDWYNGRVYTWQDSDTGVSMVGFQCGECGDISGVSKLFGSHDG